MTLGHLIIGLVRWDIPVYTKYDILGLQIAMLFSRFRSLVEVESPDSMAIVKNVLTDFLALCMCQTFSVRFLVSFHNYVCLSVVGYHIKCILPVQSISALHSLCLICCYSAVQMPLNDSLPHQCGGCVH